MEEEIKCMYCPEEAVTRLSVYDGGLFSPPKLSKPILVCKEHYMELDREHLVITEPITKNP